MKKFTNENNFVGKTFHYLTILSFEGTNNRGTIVKAKCKCGNFKIYTLTDINTGHTRSCGCLLKERKNCLKHGLVNNPLYHTWEGIKRRCYYTKHEHYKYYGGGGATMCDEWRNDFKSFYDWAIANGWLEGLEIDKDIKGDGLLYSPETCCFVTHERNMKTRRNSKMITYKGETKCLAEWAEGLDINYRTLMTRLHRNWSVEKAFN